MNDIKARISEYWDQVRTHRRYMHENPEPSHQEENTAAYVANALLDLAWLSAGGCAAHVSSQQRIPAC